MKKNEIEKDGVYIARVNGVLTQVRVEDIRKVRKAGRYDYSGRLTYSDAVVYDVINLRTGRRTMFKSATKFRRRVDCERG